MVDDSTTEAKISNAVVISLGFVGVVVTWTFLMILCIWQNCDRLLNGFLALSSLLATSLLSFTYARSILVTFTAPIDLISFFFLLYNVVILMMTSIFLMGPQTLQQISMVVGSGLIAIAFLRLPYSAYFVWSVLVIMSFYDIIAVLSPCGPLKILIKTIQNGGKLPMGLIYSGKFPTDQLQALFFIIFS